LRFDRFMEGDAFPYIGALPIASVIAPHILGQVFNYAIAAGR
jgi:hypothetical protein